MKILFLDHQGVMYIKPHPNPGVLDDFDKETVDRLNSILEEDPVIEIVVSSDWKYWVTLEKMKKFYLLQGILKAPIDYTEKSLYNGSQQRAIEIKSWLSANPAVTQWVAVDDLDMRPYLDHFVWIDKPTEGLLQTGVCEEIRNHLRH